MKYIIRLLIFIITVTSISSCMTEQRCYNRYPIPITNKDSIVFKDSLIYIPIHDTLVINSDTVSKDTAVTIINGIVNSPKLTRETDYAMAKAQVINGILKLQLIQKDSIIARLLTPKVKIVTKEKYITKTITKKVWIEHWYSKITLYVALIALGIFIYILVINVVKIIKPL